MPIPVTWNEVFARCRRVMLAKGRALTAIHTGIAPIVVWESELKQNGKTRAVPDLEVLARELGVMDPEEVKGGEWAASSQ